MPISVVAAMASVRVWAYCVTEILMEGTLVDVVGGGLHAGVARSSRSRRPTSRRRALAREHVARPARHRHAPGRAHRRHRPRAWPRATRSSSAPCAAPGSGGSRTSTPCPPRGPRCGCRERTPRAAPPRRRSTCGPRCGGPRRRCGQPAHDAPSRAGDLGPQRRRGAAPAQHRLGGRRPRLRLVGRLDPARRVDLGVGRDHGGLGRPQPGGAHRGEAPRPSSARRSAATASSACGSRSRCSATTSTSSSPAPPCGR